MIADGRNSNTGGTALGYVSAVVDSFNADWAASHSEAPPPLRVTMRAWYNPNLETRWNMIPALIGTLTFLQTLLLTAMSVAREREQGTFDQLLVTPLPAARDHGRQSAAVVLIGLIQATMILLVAQLWFRIPFAGSYVTLYAGLALFLTGRRGHGADAVGGRRDHAAGNALCFRDHDAVRAAIGLGDAAQQYAPSPPIRDAGEPAALCH